MFVNQPTSLRALAISLCALAAGAVVGAFAPAPTEVRGAPSKAPARVRSGAEQTVFDFLTAGPWRTVGYFDTTRDYSSEFWADSYRVVTF